jgi:ATP-dependent exoDNAse (exonuclease V) beta subunit
VTDRDAILRADRVARETALDTTRSFIVQAPAGSGKTELLIQRYLRLLVAVGEPEEILALTFTRKAAAEMRLRVIEALEDARLGRRADAAHRQETLSAASAVLRQDRSRDWQLVDNPGRMRIQTIDALNTSLARTLPLSLGAGGSVVIENGRMDEVYRQAAAATLGWLGAEDENGRAVGDVLRHLDANTGIYMSYIARMLENRDQWLPFVRSGRIGEADAERLRSGVERHLCTIVRQGLATALAALPQELAIELPELVGYAAANLASAGSTAPFCQFAHDGSLPGDAPDDRERWLALGDFLLTNDGKLRRKVDVLLGFPRDDHGEKARMRAMLATLDEDAAFPEALLAVRKLPPARYTDEQWAILLSVFRVLPVATVELQRIFLTRGISDYIEIAQNAAAALGTPEQPGNMALLLDYTVRHILIDEMQDTSKAQYHMLETLTAGWERGDGRTLFCVGDPMQSIYRFRNAEVTQFMIAREEGIGSVQLEPLVLRQNFRSGGHLVDWFNRSFPCVLPAVDDPVNGAVSYSSSVAAPALHGQGACIVHPGFGASVEQEARRGAALIGDLLRRHPGDSVAVLVPGRTQLPVLLRNLRERGIDYQAVDIDALTDLPEVLDLLALTRALVHRGDRIAWLGLLRGPWVGLDWTDLHALVLGDEGLTVPELLRDARRIAALSDAGRSALAHALPVIEATLQAGRSETLHSRVERCWYRLGGPALMPDSNAVDNAAHFFAALARLEIAGTLPDVARLYDELDAERVATSRAADVQVMTMHKAKGLEFDHVILYGIGRHGRGGTASIMRWIDLPGAGLADEKLVSPIGSRTDAARDPLHQFILHTDAARSAHEAARLLYVACTRAKQSLHLVGQLALRKNGSFSAPHAKSLLRRLWPVVEDDFVQAFARWQAPTNAGSDTVFVAPPFRRLARPWQAPTVRPLGSDPSADDRLRDDLRVEYDWVGLDARLAGTVVHRWLYRMALGRVPAAGDLPDGFDATTRRWLFELGAGPDVHPSIVSRVRAAIKGVTNDPRGRWILGPEGAAELALTGVHGGRLRSIVIDRVRVDDEGNHWIVDYKTSTHEGGNLEGFLGAESRRYRAQLQTYAAIYGNYAKVPVRAGLYFPLLARFVEVTLD